MQNAETKQMQNAEYRMQNGSFSILHSIFCILHFFQMLRPGVARDAGAGFTSG
jgi:hypothetical protein